MSRRPGRGQLDPAVAEHRILTFVAVAAIILGSLLVAARLVAAETPQEQPSSVAVSATAQAFHVPATPSGRASEALPEAESNVESEQPASPTPSDAAAATATTPAQPAVSEAASPTPAASAAPASTPTEPPLAPTATPSPVPTPPPPPPPPSSPPPAVAAKSFAVVERACGALIGGKNEHERLPPASTTKIVTAMVAREQASLDQMVDINVSGSDMAKRGSSVMGIEPGMRLSVLDLLYGLLMPSGNDAALALASQVGGGDTSRFVEMMNVEAAQIGMTDTHFANPHGLDNREHYSSAMDMAKAGIAALRDPVIAEISVTPSYMPAWTGTALKNGNKLLQMYPGAFGVKIGYTTNAQQTIVAAANRNGREVVVSVFGTADRYAAAISLFDWAFTKSQSQCPVS